MTSNISITLNRHRRQAHIVSDTLLDPDLLKIWLSKGWTVHLDEPTLEASLQAAFDAGKEAKAEELRNEESFRDLRS